MTEQRSFETSGPTLYLVPTPIGNLQDMTLRAIDTLKTVDVVFAEDTRHSGKLLKHFDIQTPLESLHEHNESTKASRVVAMLREGKPCALISDAGMPLVSDPGHDVVHAVLDAGFHVVSLPGPSAGLSALIASGLNTVPHLFIGFLPAKASARKKTLQSLIPTPHTMVFYEAPHRVHRTLETMHEVFGDRRVTVARELTKRHETYIRTTLADIQQLPDLKGEIVIVVEGHPDPSITLDTHDVIEHIALLMDEGLSEMDAIKRAAKHRNMSKNEAYMAYHTQKKQDRGKE